ncbi:MAG: Fe-S cluster assembly sulfur transfer protein SufU [Nitrososphaeria archaeon]|nr:SUF system NifU family Fe-S cluster assembly protein [Conexivisphaerales archaeon]
MSYFFYENVMDHYKNPRNKGKPDSYDTEYGDSNPTCGDNVKIYIKIEANRIKKIGFEGNGCALSMASASLMTEMVDGESLDNALKISEKDLMNELGIKELGPNRIKCVALPVKVLKMAIISYISKQNS